jgi:hypothetical protein
MDRLILLNAKLKSLLAHGRTTNALFKEGTKTGIHRIGEGVLRKVPINRIRSAQATVHEGKVKDMAQKLKAGQSLGPAALQHRGGGWYAAMDGNHRTNAALRAGKRKVEALVQR